MNVDLLIKMEKLLEEALGFWKRMWTQEGDIECLG